MKKILLIFVVSLFFISCGVKNEPEFESQNNSFKLIQLI